MEVLATIKSGLDAGVKQPRKLPEKKYRGQRGPGKKWVAVNEAELSGDFTKEQVSKYLGFEVEKSEHHSGTDSVLKIWGPGGRMVAFNMREWMTKSQVDAKIRGAFRCEPDYYNPTDWKRISLKILKASEEIYTGPESTTEGLIKAAVHAYLDAFKPEELAENKQMVNYPVKKGGVVHIDKTHLVKFLTTNREIKIEQKNLPSVLFTIGLKPDRLRTGGKQPRTWSISPGSKFWEDE